VGLQPGRCGKWLVLVAVTGLFLSGCRQSLTKPSLRLLPLGERCGNPWGPEANSRREANPAAHEPASPQIAEWVAFGRQLLLPGDIVLRLGHTRLIPALDLSRVLSHATDSPFSHVGIVSVEADRVFVYDVERTGVHKIPFEHWMLDVYQGVFAVKRLQEPYRDRIPLALAYCEEVYRAQVPFDASFKLSDDALYCSEMVQKAFAAAGLDLCQPVPLCCLPNFERYRMLAAVLEKVTKISLQEPVYVPGNDRYGLYASPLLETVYASPETANPNRSRQQPPRCFMAGEIEKCAE